MKSHITNTALANLGSSNRCFSVIALEKRQVQGLGGQADPVRARPKEAVPSFFVTGRELPTAAELGNGIGKAFEDSYP
jgi:hypothetical protein